MNSFQIKQKNRIIDPNKIPRRPLSEWEKQFQDYLRTVRDEADLTQNQNSKLNELAALFA